MDRRSFLATGATVALLPLTEAPALAAVGARPGSGDARLNALFEQIFQERLQNSPTLASRSDELVRRFYDDLFAAHRLVQHLFKPCEEHRRRIDQGPRARKPRSY